MYNDSLFTAREELERRKQLGEDSTCQCCGQFVLHQEWESYQEEYEKGER